MILPYIALGGLLGTVARYVLSGWFQTPAAGTFPRGTLAVNLLGSLLLGFLMRYMTGTVVVAPEIRAGLTIGFCGSLTTMSTFGYETVQLLGDGEYGLAGLYMALSLVSCVGGVLAGAGLANRLL